MPAHPALLDHEENLVYQDHKDPKDSRVIGASPVRRDLKVHVDSLAVQAHKVNVVRRA